MPKSRTLSCEARSESRNLVYGAKRRIVCNCGWELRLGYGVAVSLAIFEVKRFFLLALELFIEWQVIRFAGGYRPVVLTFIDITLGFPCALAAVYTIRKRQKEKFNVKSRKIFAYLLLTMLACAVLNFATMASIGFNVSVRQRAIAGVFNASMRLYVTTTSHKYAVDQMQFVLQCCGHSSYADWFLIDWQQQVDYASREEMSRQSRISDEIYRDRGVPFSCCDIRVLRPCVNSQMSEEDAETVNVKGCAGILSNVLVRIVFVAYTMTTMLVLTQAILAFFLAKIANRIRLDELTSVDSSQFANVSSSLLVECASPISSEEFSVTEKDYKRKRRTRRESRRDSRYKAWRSSTGSGEKLARGGCGAVFSGFSDCLQDSASSGTTSGSGARSCGGAARIKPSVHVEHRIPKNKPSIKRLS